MKNYNQRKVREQAKSINKQINIAARPKLEVFFDKDVTKFLSESFLEDLNVNSRKK